MTLKCPKCGSFTLDYKPKFQVWRCVKIECSYQEDKPENETNSHAISIAGFRKITDKKERFEWRKGTRVLVARREDYCKEDNIIIEEYLDNCITFSMPIPVSLIKKVLKFEK